MIDAKPDMQYPLIVSICGPSNAGKSQLAKALATELGDDVAARVPADYFLVPAPAGMPIGISHTRPLAWDWPLLRSRLALPMGTVTSTPVVDFDAFRRDADTGGLEFTIRPVMICDAMGAYPGSDFVVLLEVPDLLRRERILERDQRWGTRVADRWQHLEITWRVASTGLVPNLVMDGAIPVQIAAAVLARRVRELLASRGDIS